MSPRWEPTSYRARFGPFRLTATYDGKQWFASAYLDPAENCKMSWGLSLDAAQRAVEYMARGMLASTLPDGPTEWETTGYALDVGNIRAALDLLGDRWNVYLLLPGAQYRRIGEASFLAAGKEMAKDALAEYGIKL